MASLIEFTAWPHWKMCLYNQSSELCQQMGQTDRSRVTLHHFTAKRQQVWNCVLEQQSSNQRDPCNFVTGTRSSSIHKRSCPELRITTVFSFLFFTNGEVIIKSSELFSRIKLEKDIVLLELKFCNDHRETTVSKHTHLGGTLLLPRELSRTLPIARSEK